VRFGAGSTGYAISKKVVMNTSGHPNLSAALLGAFDSQIAEGKRYDLPAAGRRAANATFSRAMMLTKRIVLRLG